MGGLGDVLCSCVVGAKEDHKTTITPVAPPSDAGYIISLTSLPNSLHTRIRRRSYIG